MTTIITVTLHDELTEEAGLALLEDELARELEDEDIDRVDIITDDVSLSILSDDGQPLPSGETNTVSVYKRSKKERQRKISELYALRQKRKKTQTVDIFSLGCVFFYVLVSVCKNLSREISCISTY